MYELYQALSSLSGHILPNGKMYLNEPIRNTMRSLGIFIFLVFTSLTDLWGQVYQDVGRALQQGDAATIAAHFDNSVVIDLPGVEGIFSKSEAQKQLEVFFRNNPPTRFVQSHTGTSQGKNSQYMIGDLTLSKGSYRVYLYFKSAGGSLTIQELRIHQ